MRRGVRSVAELRARIAADRAAGQPCVLPAAAEAALSVHEDLQPKIPREQVAALSSHDTPLNQ